MRWRRSALALNGTEHPRSEAVAVVLSRAAHAANRRIDATRPRSQRFAPISVSKRSASGPTAPSPAPRPASWPCSPSSPCWPVARRLGSDAPRQGPPGIPRLARLSPILSRQCAVRSGANSISKHHRGTPIAGNSPSGCRRPGPMPSATQPEKAKVELNLLQQSPSIPVLGAVHFISRVHEWAMGSRTVVHESI